MLDACPDAFEFEVPTAERPGLRAKAVVLKGGQRLETEAIVVSSFYLPMTALESGNADHFRLAARVRGASSDHIGCTAHLSAPFSAQAQALRDHTPWGPAVNRRRRTCTAGP